MKRKTYQILRHIPIVGSVVDLTGNGPILICSPARESGIADIISEYEKAHNGVMVTNKMFPEVCRWYHARHPEIKDGGNSSL